MAQVVRVSHVIHSCSERHSSTLSSPFHPTSSSSSHSPSISCSPCCTSSTTLRTVVTLRTPPKKRWSLLTRSYFPTSYEPKNYDLMETYVESLAESLTQPQFSEQRFLEVVDYDDTALEEMLHNAPARRLVCRSVVVVRVRANGEIRWRANRATR